ncbi:hypothetical protein [Flavobacterium gelatinilyticum]|uniref:hypothetical protein n=1 Tax=Flavobacterium gelatinilyticum TaxID=3003260 RepID=UPI002480FD57|nr:hypothetical protein [Flavobacterium gelatinilyticum]
MDKRVKLSEWSDMLQATLIKCLSVKEYCCIKVSVYGYTPNYDHVDFSYEIEFEYEADRDRTFNEITDEKLWEDIKKIIEPSEIPVIL